MPVVDVEMVTESGSGARAGLSRMLADAIGNALGSDAGGTWVRLRLLDPGCYAENRVDASETPAPVFVTVLSRIRPEGRELADQVSRVTQAVAVVTGSDPGLVHVFFAESGQNRVAFGGRLVT